MRDNLKAQQTQAKFVTSQASYPRWSGEVAFDMALENSTIEYKYILKDGQD